MRRLLIDTSNQVWLSLLSSRDNEFGVKVMHEGKEVHVNGWKHGYEIAINHIVAVMQELQVTPNRTIFVVAGQHAKARREMIYPNYKKGKDSRPPEAYVQFNLCRDALLTAFLNLGAQTVTQDGVEEDDTLAYLCKHLDGEKVVLTTDGDLATCIEPVQVLVHKGAACGPTEPHAAPLRRTGVGLWRNGSLTYANPYGPFSPKYIPVYKALVGDGDEYKGAHLFGPKAFLDFLVWAGEGGLAALEGMMKRKTLHELIDDVGEFKPLKRVIDSAQHVYESYQCALLHDEWVDTLRQPMKVKFGTQTTEVTDARLKQWATPGPRDNWFEVLHPPKAKVNKNHAVYDCELIGDKSPVFLVCVDIIETGETASFWWHREGDMDRMQTMMRREDLTWVSFNGIHFDAPIIGAAIAGKPPSTLKAMANALIAEGAKHWDMPSQYDYEPFEFDHIDLMEVSPGVKVSLKTFAGRMGYPTMVDLPFHHDQDLDEEDMQILESYCQNDLGVTKALFNTLRSEVELRKEMSEEHGIDLRSKSDAQVAEAVLKKAANIRGKGGSIPHSVSYKAPSFIETEGDEIKELIWKLEKTQFLINKGNGAVESPDFLKEPLVIGDGRYQCGVGGLHSTHDKRLYVEATEDVLVSDFDVASYYPNIMLKAGLTPRLDGGAGDRFIKAYEDIYVRRMEAKHSGNTKIANALKISLNGTFGKLGSMYSAFYSPDLMLAVTLTGQLNLLTLIYDLEFNPSVKVLSANTDGIMVQYPVKYRSRIERIIAANAERTGFEYEETPYSKVAMKDVNNYIALTTSGKAKRKGLYASKGLMKNPTMQVCSDLAVEYLKTGVHPSEAIKNHTDITDFVAIRAVKGGGIQYDEVVEVDDWVLVKDLGTKDNEWSRRSWIDAGISRVVKRKSQPRPVQVGVGGQKFGRIARWIMVKGSTTPINYVGSGNTVPKTTGARLCMTLPRELPADLDYDWYVAEAVSMLEDMGVVVDKTKVTV
jgi:hypothetical protein